jgi:hypothetical protein
MAILAKGRSGWLDGRRGCLPKKANLGDNQCSPGNSRLVNGQYEPSPSNHAGKGARRVKRPAIKYKSAGRDHTRALSAKVALCPWLFGYMIYLGQPTFDFNRPPPRFDDRTPLSRHNLLVTVTICPQKCLILASKTMWK